MAKKNLTVCDNCGHEQEMEMACGAIMEEKNGVKTEIFVGDWCEPCKLAMTNALERRKRDEATLSFRPQHTYLPETPKTEL
jgi:hypothetical protein